VQSRELYERYYRLILGLARRAQPCSSSLEKVRNLLHQFESEAAEIAPNNLALLREHLSEQLEHAALCSPHMHQRRVLFAAVKRLEQVADPD
jgi:hypothetical protein